MKGYRDDTYGNSFADVYDDWYATVSDVATTVETLTALADGGTVLELGIGTGRLALPLAAAGLEVHGIDASAAMLDHLRAKPGGSTIPVIEGDMVDDAPPGPFRLVFVAYNTLFNLTATAELTAAERQQALMHAIMARLEPGGRFVVEAFVPDDPPRGSSVSVRSMSVDHVVLSVEQHHPDDQSAEGHFVELTESGGVRLRPWSIRWTRPDQLDGMAEEAGMVLVDRWASFDRQPFTDESDRHVSVYRRPPPDPHQRAPATGAEAVS